MEEEYVALGQKTVICILTLENGFEVTGLASCVDPENFDFEIGQQIAREDAVNQIWKLEGYLLQQDKYEDELLEEEDLMFLDDDECYDDCDICTGRLVVVEKVELDQDEATKQAIQAVANAQS